jgi:hypothetical protein
MEAHQSLIKEGDKAIFKYQNLLFPLTVDLDDSPKFESIN